MKLVNSWRIKLLLAAFGAVLFWHSCKLYSLYTINPEVKVFVEKQNAQSTQSTQQILVTVYYEALCPDSRNFILKQLLPAFNSIEDYIELQLIPYGKAKTIVVDNDYKFECQHGQVECDANIVHACSTNKMRDSRKLLELIACMIKNNMHPIPILNTCGSELEEYKSILECSQSAEGRRLLMKFGEVTNELRPKVSFIPTITLDNDMDNQILILKDLLQQICKRLESPPKACNR